MDSFKYSLFKMENWKAQNTHIRLKGEEEPKTSMVPAIIAIIIFVVLVVCTLNIQQMIFIDILL